jgi:uncharacterized glyoxalase superfamily protein PhnB
MADPFLDLRMRTGPIQPRAAFAAELRRRLERALLVPTDPSESTDPSEGAAMTTTSEFIPQRLHAVTPYLGVSDARAAIAFYEEVLGATLLSDPIVMDDGRVGHAELEINGSVVMLADEFPDIGHHSPTSLGGASAGFVVYVPDVDAALARALAAGATQREPAEERYGARSAWITDPFGHRWNISTASEA